MPRNLIFIAGDQLNADAAAFEGADPATDLVIMAEVREEITRHANHRQRVTLFLSAMRHFRDRLENEGYTVAYQEVGDSPPADSLPAYLEQQIEAHAPEGVVMTRPGRFELEEACRKVAEHTGVPIDIRSDTHFMCSREEFAAWAEGRKSLVMEYFYREMRSRYGYLMDDGDPAGGSWNYDQDNRESFDSGGPGEIPRPLGFETDAITRAVLDLVDERFPELCGSTDAFDWPVTPEQARAAVDDFVTHRLPRFGTYQDAMWTDEPYLYHARISAALNLKLIDPRDVIEQAVGAYEAGDAPINAVEGFIRQILGWREFMRGVYWHEMPAFEACNALEADRDLPGFFWTGQTDMHCLQQVVEQLLEQAYAHHIQRLMVSGLFALLYGVEPRQVHDWFMAMYVDSVEWVTMPNTIGMSQYADGGIVGTKPYAATGKYINRMSNYCKNCAYDPDQSTGDEACPFTTLYWEFLMTNEERLADNHRMRLQLSNLQRKSEEDRDAIAVRSARIREKIDHGKRV